MSTETGSELRRLQTGKVQHYGAYLFAAAEQHISSALTGMLVSAVPIIRDSLRVLLEQAPPGIDVEEVGRLEGGRAVDDEIEPAVGAAHGVGEGAGASRGQLAVARVRGVGMCKWCDGAVARAGGDGPRPGDARGSIELSRRPEGQRDG